MRPQTKTLGIAVFVALLIAIALFLPNIASHLRKAQARFFEPKITYVDDMLAAPTFGLRRHTADYTEDDWKRILTPEQYYILRKAGTETPFTSPLLKEHRPGTYVSADCNEPVFRSEQKFDSGTGWPSFWAPINADAIVTSTDNSLFMERVEVRSPCGGHLGHVFTDGPAPTGLRYCMNGDALKFIPD